MRRVIVVDDNTYKFLKKKGIPFEYISTCKKLEKIVDEIIEQEIYEYSFPSETTMKLKELLEEACKPKIKTRRRY